jgi:putative endonuclease
MVDIYDKTRVGRIGEQLAAKYLKLLDYSLVAANFKLPVGRNSRQALVFGEIDIVAYEKRILCFVEVKTRRSDSFLAPEANVDLRKQRQIIRAARAYRRIFGLESEPFRYDVVSVILPSIESTDDAQIEIFRDYWREDKFLKRNWTDL